MNSIRNRITNLTEKKCCLTQGPDTPSNARIKRSGSERAYGHLWPSSTFLIFDEFQSGGVRVLMPVAITRQLRILLLMKDRGRVQAEQGNGKKI
jgi:hypothetical protein